MRPSFVASIIMWLIVQTPRVATACSVCTVGRDEENAAAFLLTTIFMSVTPLIVIGSIVYLLWRRVRKFEAAKEARQQEIGTASISTPTAR